MESSAGRDHRAASRSRAAKKAEVGDQRHIRTRSNVQACRANDEDSHHKRRIGGSEEPRACGDARIRTARDRARRVARNVQGTDVGPPCGLARRRAGRGADRLRARGGGNQLARRRHGSRHHPAADDLHGHGPGHHVDCRHHDASAAAHHHQRDAAPAPDHHPRARVDHLPHASPDHVHHRRAAAHHATLPLPLTTPTVTLPPLPTTTLGRVSTTSLTLPVTTSTVVVPLPTTTLPLPLTTTTVTLPPLPTTTLGRVSTTSLTLPPTTSTIVVPLPTTTLPLPLTTTTVTLPPLPTTTLGRVSTTSLTLPLTTSTIVVPLPTTTLPLPLTTTTVTLPPLPTTTLGHVSTTSLTLALTTSTIVVPPSTTLRLPLTTTTVTLPSLPTSTTLPQALCVGSCDDGFSCTDDVCTTGGCQHVPIDSRCVPPDACTAAVCAPALPGHDAAGCIAGAPQAEGEACAEDGDACTTDVCRGGICAHEPAVDTTSCAPVQEPFRQTLALGELTQGLEADVAAAGEALAPLVGRLAGIESDLAAAARALAGEPVADSGSTRALAVGLEPAEATGLSADQRARIAFTAVLHTPRQVNAFLDDLAAARQRAGLPPAVARDLHRRGRMLLRGTKALKAKLRRLQRDHGRRHARKRSRP